MVTIPLSKLVPTWVGHCIPEAYAALEKGILHQRARFLFDRYLVISLVHDLDIDGYQDYLYLDAGLRTRGDAIETCARVLNYRLLGAQIRIGPQTAGWQTIDKGRQIKRQVPSKIDVMAWEKLGDGTGFNSISVQVGVFEANQENPLDVDDLSAIGFGNELQWYLSHEGAL